MISLPEKILKVNLYIGNSYKIIDIIVSVDVVHLRGLVMEYHQIITDRIAALCKKRGLSINKLASMAGVKQSTLDIIVRGISKNPRIKTLHKISHAFGMTPSEFLDFPEMNDFSFDDIADDDDILDDT